MFQFLIASWAAAATLPGVAIPFDIDAEDRWVLAEDLPGTMSSAGAQPGWALVEVDGQPFGDPAAVRRRVAAGPARDVQLRFATDPAQLDGQQVIIVARRAPLVSAQLVDRIDWPDTFAHPSGAWQEDWASLPVLTDRAGTGWLIDVDNGTVSRGGGGDFRTAIIPDLFWGVTEVPWVVDLGNGPELSTADKARQTMGDGIRLPAYRGQAGDHILLKDEDGVRVVAIDWPRGTPVVPTCRPRVPETCLASGSQILQDLGDRRGAREEAMRHFGLACAHGVHRACYETIALEDESTAPRVAQCLDGDVLACNDVAQSEMRFNPDEPTDLVVGLLEYACELEGTGTLGERLRRLEDVGAGCMGLAAAYDARGVPDLALLNLDQACVLGRADACEQSAERRHLAYALRTVRECEDPEVPIAVSCVELGRLLQDGEVPVATLDDFDAFQRGCSLGATEGCVQLADYVDRWSITNPRVAAAEVALRKACSEGEQRACLGAAHLLVRHDPKAKAYAEALEHFSGACNEGLGDACVAGAQQRRIGAARRLDAPTQIDLWTTGCDLNSPDGCAGLGERQARAKSTWPEAYTAWTRACDLGDAHACSEVGRLVSKPHDPWEAEQPSDSYLSRGCTNGDPEGCFWLAEGTLPSRGEPDEATYLLLNRSCDGEHGPGCARLASVHLERDTSFDDEIAARHLGTACANSHFESCKDLGTMYVHGKGVERDRQRAKELFDRFRLNAKRRHVRVGLNVGLPTVAGGDIELVLPIPVGPALSVGGTFSFIPTGGSVLALIEGEDTPEQLPDLQIVQAIGRLYPNPRARGIYGAFGIHRLSSSGGSTDDRSREGVSGRVGLRSQSGIAYTAMELGVGNFGVVKLNDFDEDENGVIPLILPTFSFGFGLAFL